MFKANGGNQHILDPDIFVAPDQFVVKLRATASGLERQRQGWHGSQQSFLADLAARPGYSKEQFIGRNDCYKAVQLSHGAFDRGCAWIATFQKGNQGAGVYADAGKGHAFHPCLRSSIAASNASSSASTPRQAQEGFQPCDP